MKKDIIEPDEEDLVLECRKYESKGRYEQLFGIIDNNPKVLNYFTVGELGRYVRTGIYNRVSLKIIKRMRKNIERIIFKGGKI